VLPLPGADNGEPQVALSTRASSGWVTTPLMPPQGPGELDNIFSGDGGANPFHVSLTSDF
jgi:hypothetical protein